MNITIIAGKKKCHKIEFAQWNLILYIFILLIFYSYIFLLHPSVRGTWADSQPFDNGSEVSFRNYSARRELKERKEREMMKGREIILKGLHLSYKTAFKPWVWKSLIFVHSRLFDMNQWVRVIVCYSPGKAPIFRSLLRKLHISVPKKWCPTPAQGGSAFEQTVTIPYLLVVSKRVFLRDIWRNVFFITKVLN